MFHNSGHIICYHRLLQFGTAMTEKKLQTMDAETGAVNFVHGRFIHFTCDNININDSKLDGTNTFHATQMAWWQHGPEGNMLMQDLKASNRKSLQIPNVMEKLIPAGVVSKEKALPK